MGDQSSTILATKYGKEAIRLIRSATHSLTYVIYISAALALFSLLDLFGVLYHFQLYSEIQHDYIISIIALVLLGVLVPLVWRVLKARMCSQIMAALFGLIFASIFSLFPKAFRDMPRVIESMTASSSSS